MRGFSAINQTLGNTNYKGGMINFNHRLCFQAHDDYYNCIDNIKEESI